MAERAQAGRGSILGIRNDSVGGMKDTWAMGTSPLRLNLVHRVGAPLGAPVSTAICGTGAASGAPTGWSPRILTPGITTSQSSPYSVFEAILHGLKNVAYSIGCNRNAPKETGRSNLWRPVSDNYARQLMAAGTARTQFLRPFCTAPKNVVYTSPRLVRKRRTWAA